MPASMAPNTKAADKTAGAMRRTVSVEGPGASSSCGAALRATSTGTRARRSMAEPIAKGATPRVPSTDRMAGPDAESSGNAGAIERDIAAAVGVRRELVDPELRGDEQSVQSDAQSKAQRKPGPQRLNLKQRKQ